MMKPLILESLEIRQFRAFRHLSAERLGRVNLIVGKNNIGKTCLLEALSLYASRGSLLLMQRLLEARDEGSHLPARSVEDAEDQSVRYLFCGRNDLMEQPAPIQIGPVNSPDDTLSIAVVWFTEHIDEDGRRRLSLLQPETYDTVDIPIPGLAIRIGAQLILNYPLDRDIRSVRHVMRPEPKFKEIDCIFISANGLSRTRIDQLWDSIALTDLEQDVLASLHIIAPQVERVTLVGSQERGKERISRERIPMVRIAGLGDPLPLRSLGEGMNRLFGVALALVNAQGGMLLIDEVESGLHYSAQSDLWCLIFQVARRLNVQVFATTHSWDCIEAFQQAVQEDGQGEGLLISLRDKEDEPGQVAAVLFDEQELAVVTREQIEVR